MPTSTPHWLPAGLALLDDRFPLPLSRPFTAAMAQQVGVSRWHLANLVRRSLLRELVRGVYVAAQTADSLDLRATALSLVVSKDKVVTDRTAAWLHGVDILPRSAVHEAPPVQAFDRGTSRIRRGGVASGVRTLAENDVMQLDGVHVTTPLRTALDLGRLIKSRYDAIAALDAFLRAGVDQCQLLSQVERFRGDRGVRQLRELAPIADPRAESPPESALRLHWIDGGLPAPTPQFWVEDTYRLDLALPEELFGAEYNGELFHGSPEARDRDRRRLTWLDGRQWTIVEIWKDDLYGIGATPIPILVAGLAHARARRAAWQVGGRAL